GGEPDRQLLEAPEGCGRLGQLGLAKGRSGPGFEIGARQMRHQRPDLIEIRNRVSHGMSFCCRVARATVALMSSTRLFADFAAATAFLTRIPAPRPVNHAGLLADAASAFPLVVA